jgi:hypothetical protein
MYVIFSILSSPPCEPKWDEKEVKQLIENIEKKMILDKLETFYCAYSVMKDYYDLHSKTCRFFGGEGGFTRVRKMKLHGLVK